jgi:hypothetical protein
MASKIRRDTNVSIGGIIALSTVLELNTELAVKINHSDQITESSILAENNKYHVGT